MDWKARFESGQSYPSFKSVGPGACNTGCIGSTCTALPAAVAFQEACRFPKPSRVGLETRTARLLGDTDSVNLAGSASARSAWLPRTSMGVMITGRSTDAELPGAMAAPAGG